VTNFEDISSTKVNVPGTYFERDDSYLYPGIDNMDLAFTICYTAWASNNLDMELSAPAHLQEAGMEYKGKGNFALDSILSQYGIGIIPNVGVMAMVEPGISSSPHIHNRSLLTRTRLGDGVSTEMDICSSTSWGSLRWITSVYGEE
jgi:hypothetical protein